MKKYRSDNKLGAVKFFGLFFAGKNDIADEIDLFLFKIRVERQSEYLLADLQGDGGIVGIEFAVEAVECVGERVEILSCENIVFCKHAVYLVTVTAELFRFDDNWEICVIGFYIGRVLIQSDALGDVKAFVITLNNCAALVYLVINMAEVAYAHSGTEFVHLCVCAYGFNDLGTVDTEVFQVVDSVSESGVFKADSTALDGVEYLCSVEAEAGNIAVRAYALALVSFAESMCGIVDNFKTVLICDALYLLDIADISVNVNGNDS